MHGCRELTSLNLKNFDTSKVTSMQSMFNSCSKLKELDLSSFDTKKVTNMFRMFINCNELTKIYISNSFVTLALTDDNVLSGETIIGTNSTHLFDSCTNLVGGAGTTYDASHTDKTYAHIDGGPSNPGYFTRKENT